MFYLDTSFLVPYFIPEKASRAVEKFLSSIKTGELAISQWTRTEFVSALGIKIRTQRFSEDAARRALAKDRKGQHSIRINDQWRICFVWRDGHAEAVEIVDYH